MIVRILCMCSPSFARSLARRSFFIRHAVRLFILQLFYIMNL